MFFIILICAVIIFVIFMYKEAYRNKINQLILTYPNFPGSIGEIRIFFISDIHRRLVDKTIIDQMVGKADIVIIGGDLTEKGVPYSRTRENLKRLNEIGPVFFVWGNNDYEVSRSYLLEIFMEHNVTVLENSHIQVNTETDEIFYIIGIGECSYDHDLIHEALSEIDRDGFKLVICHNPDIIKKISEADKVDLILSGHTHGGQINFFGLGLYPVGKFQHYQQADMLISNGYGTTSLPLRFWARAETHYIIIKQK